MSQEDRSETLIQVLDELEQSNIGFVLIGGYAISQFEPRFSTDLDLVIAPDDYDEVVAFLEARGFERQADLEVPPEETIYNREIELFERTEGLPHPVGVDILVNGLGCRQTKAEWSFDYLRTHSSPTVISGGTRSTTARAADGEVLVAAKLHSGRKTDLADVLAAIPSTRSKHICIAETLMRFVNNSVMHKPSSKKAGWITDSRACSANRQHQPKTSRRSSSSSNDNKRETAPT